ncbi:NlpC/P60 family protein [Collinsella ihumii]|uniref:NlpC/P60 family protein n=1 Tax=Collinsella ihumii TaxID=1720204 RepID=A0AAW7K3A0_9ACTN|nr:C40 family peptidase [Collinsella ihumii]MDN0069682.1 NlpC/P60 family protein [Collinsella ihumii]
MKLKRTRTTLALLLSGALTFSTVPVALYAEPTATLQEQVDEAYSTLMTYTQELEYANNQLFQVQEDLASIQEQIKQTESDIATKQAELEEGQAALSDRVSVLYKQGGFNLMSVVLGVSDFEELFSRVYYANKVAEQDAALVNSVKTTKAELEEKQSALAAQEAEQKQLVSDQEAKTSEVQTKLSVQQSYYNGLDSELQTQLAAEAAARAAEAAAEAERAQEQENNSDGGSTTDTTTGGDTNTDANTPDASTPSGGTSSPSTPNTPSGGGSDNTVTTPDPEPEPEPEPEPPTDTGNTDSGNAPSGVVDVALAQVGKPYVWAASGPDSFDCSGLTSYAYRQMGISIPHSSQSQYNLVSSKGHLVYSVSALSPGDLVFWGYGGSGSSIYHVGMYIGGGQYVHASMPGVGVVVGTLSTGGNFAGGGSPV